MGANPKLLAVYSNAGSPVVNDGVIIFPVVLVGFELGAIKPAKAIGSANPDKSIIAFLNKPDGIAWQTIFPCKLFCFLKFKLRRAP